MKLRAPKLNPVVRLAAAGMLLVWVAAVTACTTGWLEDDSHSAPAQMTQADGKCGAPQNTGKQDCHDNPFCLSLHSLCQQSTGTALVKPDFGLAFTLIFIPAAQLSVPAQLETAISRQSPDCNRVFTPEVCLGPAFHSLAPPVPA